ncbi:MAG TPA: DNA polymerase III subunit alpha [Bacilli bacterium]|nr:DNA polymerase III subunit alpha [Bacilli bacterium]
MYIPLYVKTDYSLLSSMITIDELINKCIELHITSIAICDDNLCGVMEFYNKCTKNKIKPIIGLDLIFNGEEILLYAKNNLGYKNLIKLETLKNKKELNIEKLKKYSENLIAILKYRNIAKYQTYSEIFNNLYLGISHEEEMKDNKYNYVFINETLYLEKYQYKYLPYLLMIRDSKDITEGINFIYKNNYLFGEEVSKFVSNKVLNNTLLVGDMCNVNLASREIYMPKYNIDGDMEAFKYLKKLCYAGIKKRLGDDLTKIYIDRIDRELDIIKKMGYEDYFLVVYDYIKYAKNNDILVGPGRGSAAGSLVSFSLGITDVDSIKYDLLFERFLNPERISMPDIDTDFPDIDREKVIDYVKEKYGNDNVGSIVTFGTLGAKQALRDIGRVLNIPIKDIDYLCKHLGFNDQLRVLKEDKTILNYIENDEMLKLLYQLAQLFENNKRHTSTHAAGIVISKKKLDEIVPVMVVDDMLQTEFTMDYLEENGLIKMDFLGIRHLTTIKNILDDILKYENKRIIFRNIPLDDDNVYEVFRLGDTAGIFQFESDGMKKFLKELKPTTFNDLVAAIALYRPGPASNIPSYINRKHGKERISYFDDSLLNILASTYGIIIYQEQIMQIANQMAGYSLGEADILRKAMSKKKLDVLKNEEKKFINGAIDKGYSKEVSINIFNTILKFAGYGFNKSHSVSYAIVSYKMAYLKYYYKKYFYKNLLTGHIGSESKTKEYINEAKKLGLNILTPDVRLSTNKYEIYNNDLILPISMIRNVGSVIANYIINERNNNNFTDIYDFLIRTYDKTNNKKIYESLVFASFFKNFNLNCRTLIENKDIICNYVDLVKDLGSNDIEKPIIKIYDEFDNDYLLEQEKEIFGFYVTSHKTEKFKLLNNNIIDTCDIDNYFNKIISIIICVDKIKNVTTKNGEEMAFVNGSDAFSSASITIFPKILKNVSIKKGDILKINGKVEKRYNDYQLVANVILKL